MQALIYWEDDEGPSATTFAIAGPPTTTFANEVFSTTEIAFAVFSSTAFAIEGTTPGLAWEP